MQMKTVIVFGRSKGPRQFLLVPIVSFWWDKKIIERYKRLKSVTKSINISYQYFVAFDTRFSEQTTLKVTFNTRFYLCTDYKLQFHYLIFVCSASDTVEKTLLLNPV